MKCISCGDVKCQLICRALGCNVARHAKCFGIDREKYKLVMGDQAGKDGGLHVHHDAGGYWVCPEHVVAYEYRDLTLPRGEVLREVIELETVRQYMWFYSRSSKATMSNMSSGYNMIRRFENEFGIAVSPSVYGLDDHSEIASSWLVMKRAAEVKVQSLGSVYSAFAHAYAAANLANPHNHPQRNHYSTGGHSRKGLGHVLGINVMSQPRIPLAVVMELQDHCFARAAAATSKWQKLQHLELGFYVTASYMGFLRPNELPQLCWLYGMWLHFFIGERAERCGVVRPYVGVFFGEPEVDVTTGVVTATGGQSKVTRSNQRIDVDQRGSEVVIYARAQNGLNPGKFLADLMALHGVDAYSMTWPANVSKKLPLFHSPGGARRYSSIGVRPFLPQVRAALIYLKATRKLPDLQTVVIDKKLTNYWMKIGGASEAQARGVPEWLRNGHGRWRLFAQDPPEMVRHYAKASVREKLSCSDFGAPWKAWD